MGRGIASGSFCDRSYLSGALAAACIRGLGHSKSNDWLRASVLALRLRSRDSVDGKEMDDSLQDRLTNLNTNENSRLFWVVDALMQSLDPTDSPYQRLIAICPQEGPVSLDAERDLEWIKEALGDACNSAEDRRLLLEAATFLPRDDDGWQNHLLELKPLVDDQPSLVSFLDEQLKQTKYDEHHARWQRQTEYGKQEQQQKKAEAKAAWTKFWHEVAQHPDRAFSPEHGFGTARNLWQAMSRDGDYGRSTGWNRRFIEVQFGEDIADRLRCTLMGIWRNDYVTLASERPKNQRNTHLTSWRLGLAAIYAEAEDQLWASKLSEDEAKLAARYSILELGGLPPWLAQLVEAWPSAVEAVLGNELSWELNCGIHANGHSKLLQNLNYGPKRVGKLFLPQLLVWLGQNPKTHHDSEIPGRLLLAVFDR